MIPAQQQYPIKKAVNRAEAIYSERLRSLVETDENVGKFITIEILSGDYEIGTDHIQTALRLRARHADPITSTLRIGYKTAFVRGGRLQPLPR